MTIVVPILLILILFPGIAGAKEKYLDSNYSFKPEQRVKWTEDNGLMSSTYEVVGNTPKNTPHSHSWVNDIVRDGDYAIKLEMHGNDCGGDDCARRDVGNYTGAVGRTEFGFFNKKHSGENWFRWSIYIPETTAHIDGYTMLNQFKTDTRADINDCPTIPLYFKLGDDGMEISRELGGCGPNHNFDNNENLITYDEGFRGKWLDFVVHANWSNKDNGFVHIWVNGEKRYEYLGATIHPKIKNYNKYPPVPRFGIYNGKRDENSTDKQVVYYDAFYIAKTCENMKLETLGYSCKALMESN
tara:strand:- start:693 stop:1589 length:897 start_codon:yes stop_codon:yes gene_type:complete